MDYITLQKRLVYAINKIGIKARSISKMTGISDAELSRFKNGKAFLSAPAAKKLQKYLDGFYMVTL